jgi:DMSO/TMAO reductase YedYZ molybdopterin-dependent catalytic subunit
LRDEALAADALLAYEMNGAPLPVQHGFPLRLVVPGWYGMANVKWLARIEAVGAPFAGYQQARGYRIRLSEEEDGEPLTRMAPRSLLVPPGIPEFLTRERLVETGACALDGRAWSGHAPVARVEVSTDGGETWGDAVLEPRDPDAPFAWRRWTFAWAAPAGDAVLGSRAFDEAGNGQPLEPAWNVGGYGNNAVQWVRVRVR